MLCPIHVFRTNVVQRPDAAKCPFAQQTLNEIGGQPLPGNAGKHAAVGAKLTSRGCPHAAAAKAAKASQGFGYSAQVREEDKTNKPFCAAKTLSFPSPTATARPRGLGAMAACV